MTATRLAARRLIGMGLAAIQWFRCMTMSDAGLAVFDKTLQTTQHWLDELCSALGESRQVAWKVLSVVLHILRDRLPLDLAAHLGAMLPLLVRGAYYDQFVPNRLPFKGGFDAFVDEVAQGLARTRGVAPRDAMRAVFALLSAHLDRGQVDKVQHALPADLRQFWLNARAGSSSAV